ncbi:MAG: methyl-accepting chemotaxis protein, partial [Huintestinicola sp.]
MKFKTIKKHVTVITIMIVMIPLFILSSISTASSYYSSVKLTENSLGAIAQNAAERTQWELQAFVNIASQAGTMSALADPVNSESRKKDILTQIANQYGLERGNLIDNHGNGIDGNNYEDREYYQEAMKGNTFVSDPLVSKVTGKITIIVAAPLWQNGIYGTTV